LELVVELKNNVKIVSTLHEHKICETGNFAVTNFKLDTDSLTRIFGKQGQLDAKDVKLLFVLVVL